MRTIIQKNKEKKDNRARNHKSERMIEIKSYEEKVCVVERKRLKMKD